MYPPTPIFQSHESHTNPKIFQSCARLTLVMAVYPVRMMPIAVAIRSPMAISSAPIQSVHDIEKHLLGNRERLPGAAILSQEHGELPVEQLRLDLTRRSRCAAHVRTRSREGLEHGSARRRRYCAAQALVWAPPVVDVGLLRPVEADLAGLGKLGRVAAGGGEVDKQTCALGEGRSVAAIVQLCVVGCCQADDA